MNTSKIERITRNCNAEENMTTRKLNNRLKKAEAQEMAEKNQKHVKSITITIEWKKSATWGYNPHAEASIYFDDNTLSRVSKYTCSGCGYDKESTVISQIFNDFLTYKLWDLENKEVNNIPYGIRLNYDYSPTFEGGIGTNCYNSISKFIGGEFEHVSSGKSFDVYKFTMNN